MFFLTKMCETSSIAPLRNSSVRRLCIASVRSRERCDGEYEVSSIAVNKAAQFRLFVSE